MKLLIKICCFFILSIFCFAQMVGVSLGLSAEQKKLLNKNILYFDLACSSVGAADDSSTGPIESVYMRGDSITAGADKFYKLEDKFKAKGIEATATGSGGGTVSRGGPNNASQHGDLLSGLEALDRDKNKVSTVDAVVVAYGTNNYNESRSAMESEIKKMVNKIKEINDSAQIFWVNIKITDSSGMQKINDAIEGLSSSLNYTVIDYASSGIPLGDDFHPAYSEAGHGRWGQLIVDNVSTASASVGEPEISGTVQELAQQILDDQNINKSGREVTADLEEAASGQPSHNGKTLNTNILEAILALSDEKPSITSLTGNGSGHSNGSAHYSGNAVDIGGLNGRATNGSDEQAQKIVDITTQVLPEGSEFGLGSSPNSIDLPSGFSAFKDNPNHVHIETSASSDEYKDPTVTVPGGCECPATGATLAGDNNAEKIWNFLIENDFTPEQAAGFLGNFWVESKFDPGITEIGGGGGYGIAQWTDRRSKLEAYAQQQGRPVDSLELQLDFMMYELNGSESAAYEAIKAETEVGSINPPGGAWYTVSIEYERPAEPKNPLRGEKAHFYYNKFARGVTGGGSGSPDSSGMCGSGEGEPGAVNANGYALPVPPEVNGSKVNLPCGEDTCHHDGTPAADLGISDPWEGAPVYAIFDGVIENLHYRSGLGSAPAPRECISFQFKGDDGWYYWYGHIKNPTVSNGDKVKAGDKLAVIGQSACADNTPPHLHIDRGSPKGEYGGSECCRDPAFIPLLDKIYEDAITARGRQS